MGVDIEYLLTFLADELRDMEDMRITPTFPTTTRKAADLPQDYDPNESTIHLNRGVTVRVRSREFFFPAAWAREGRQDLIGKLTNEIRAYFGD